MWNSAYNKLTKYCPVDQAFYWDGEGFPDGKTVLDPDGDAAHVNLGGNWRMPTDVEWTELLTNCTLTWTSLNGVNGYSVTATNGNSIFLPAGGNYSGTSLEGVGPLGNYWSSSLYTKYSNLAWLIGFYSDEEVGVGVIDRYNGRSVRPVTE